MQIPRIDIPAINHSEPILKYRNPFEREFPKTVVVLGNGFDMDLGLKTSYNSFAACKKFWPFEHPVYQYDECMGNFLNKKRDIEKWLDLEEALAEYANIDKKTNNVDEDKVCFKVLSQKLSEYLRNEQENFELQLGAVPAAYSFLEIISQKKDYYIYSFNYTNLYLLANKIGVKLDANRIQHIHGSLKDNDIILGTGDVAELPDDYAWLYKSFNFNYQSNNLVEDITDADEVFIFGHSFGKNDFDYFIDFFEKSIHQRETRMNMTAKGYDKIKLRIITKDDKSELAIKKQLRILTDKHVQGLYAHCDCKIFHTQGDLNWVTIDEL